MKESSHGRYIRILDIYSPLCLVIMQISFLILRDWKGKIEPIKTYNACPIYREPTQGKEDKMGKNFHFGNSTKRSQETIINEVFSENFRLKCVCTCIHVCEYLEARICIYMHTCPHACVISSIDIMVIQIECKCRETIVLKRRAKMWQHVDS